MLSTQYFPPTYSSAIVNYGSSDSEPDEVQGSPTAIALTSTFQPSIPSLGTSAPSPLHSTSRPPVIVRFGPPTAPKTFLPVTPAAALPSSNKPTPPQKATQRPVTSNFQNGAVGIKIRLPTSIPSSPSPGTTEAIVDRPLKHSSSSPSSSNIFSPSLSNTSSSYQQGTAQSSSSSLGPALPASNTSVQARPLSSPAPLSKRARMSQPSFLDSLESRIGNLDVLARDTVPHVPEVAEGICVECEVKKGECN